jgi:bifunctional UDP-N-acetylglucosamine pyrophosphorylase/glucosamine-1-phosphate N-acetyltransferase
MSKAAVILAAGQGTRMKSALPKVLHKVAGLPLLGHVVAALKSAGVERIVVVTSAAGEDVRFYAKTLGAECAIQHQQLGTGHAAASAQEEKDEVTNYDGILP